MIILHASLLTYVILKPKGDSMEALYTAFIITWVAIFAYIIYMIRTRLQLNRELARLGRLVD